jgi:hypothetical protein
MMQNFEPETGSISVRKYLCVIAGFSSEVDEIFDLLRNYTVHGGNSLPTYQKNLSLPFFLSWNVGKELPPYAA